MTMLYFLFFSIVILLVFIFEDKFIIVAIAFFLLVWLWIMIQNYIEGNWGLNSYRDKKGRSRLHTNSKTENRFELLWTILLVGGMAIVLLYLAWTS